MAKSRNTLGIAAVGLALLAIFLAVRGCQQGKVQDIELMMPCACSSCGWSGMMELTDRPGVCPECKEKAVWPAMKCASCGHHQAIDLLRFNQEGREPYCTKCKGRRLVPIAPDEAWPQSNP